MNGIKIVSSGSVDSAKAADLSVDSESQLWICDLKKKPKHYGLLKATISYIAPFSTRTLLSIQHGYEKTPSFITEWFYPAGTSGSPAGTNQTYGIGSLEALIGSDIFSCRVVVSPSTFRIFIDNDLGSNPITDQYVEFRYYVFAPPLNDVLKAE